MAMLNVREFGCCHCGESFDCMSSSILSDVRHSPAIPQLKNGRATAKIIISSRSLCPVQLVAWLGRGALDIETKSFTGVPVYTKKTHTLMTIEILFSQDTAIFLTKNGAGSTRPTWYMPSAFQRGSLRCELLLQEPSLLQVSDCA